MAGSTDHELLTFQNLVFSEAGECVEGQPLLQPILIQCVTLELFLLPLSYGDGLSGMLCLLLGRMLAVCGVFQNGAKVSCSTSFPSIPFSCFDLDLSVFRETHLYLSFPTDIGPVTLTVDPVVFQRELRELYVQVGCPPSLLLFLFHDGSQGLCPSWELRWRPPPSGPYLPFSL